jgi:PAS domain S-box-containing protein
MKNPKTSHIKNYIDIIESDFFLIGPVVAFIWNNDTKWSVEMLSKNIQNLFGYDAQLFIGGKITYSSLIHPDDLQRVTQEVADACHNKLNSFTHELYRLQNSEGNYQWVKDSTSIVYNENGEITHFIGYIICANNEIEENKKLNELLSKETSKLKTLVNAIPDLVFMKDPKGIYLACNKRFEDFFGATEKEIVGKTDYDFVDKELADFFREHDTHAMNSPAPLSNFEEIPFAIDGHIEYVQTTKTKVIDKNNHVIGILGITRDFTEQKVYREKIESQRKELETIFNTTKDGIAILDLETNFVKVNQAYCEITGYSEEELLKTSCIALTHPDDIEITKMKVADLFTFGFVENYEKRCVLNNKTITVNLSVTLLPNKNYMLASMKDITHVKIFEEQSKLAAMGEMIGNIAHQWRQPLSVITTLASSIEIKQEFGTLTQNILTNNMETIISQANYLSNTIDDFRNFIRKDEEKLPIDIKETLRKTLSLVYAALQNHNITVIQNIEDTICIDGYENELIQSFINIINNAKDAINKNIATEDDKLIFIETKKVANGLIVEIKDNGGGIPSAVISRIFEPYFTTKHKSVGTGIGLSMTHKLLEERHKATIQVKNTKYDYNNNHHKGASFEILFTTTETKKKEE